MDQGGEEGMRETSQPLLGFCMGRGRAGPGRNPGELRGLAAPWNVDCPAGSRKGLSCWRSAAKTPP